MAAGGAANYRNTRRQKRIIADLRTRRDPCWLCGQAIDYGAPAGDPNSFQADHVKPWSKFPELREDPANYRASHEGCNKSRGNGDPPEGLGVRSREW